MEQSPLSEKLISLKENIFLKQLKEGTAADHMALENLPLSLAITSPSITIEDYSNYLLKMLPVVQDLEENIYPIISAEIRDIEQRRKLDLIKNDLKEIGTTIPASPDMPLSQQGTSISVAFAMGIMYVMEGSTLGGKFIGQNIQRTLGYDARLGAKYFAGYESRTGFMWKSFLEILTRFESKHNASDGIIAGANFAFKSIHRYFNE